MNNFDIIKTKILEFLEINKIHEDIEITFERCKELKFGDYTTNVAFRLAKLFKKAPSKLAEEIKTFLFKKNLPILKIEALNGYLNFFFNDKFYQLILDNVENNRIFAFKKTNKKFLLEYVSANPTGLLHIGHGRGAAFGDSLYRLLTFTGNKVVREYYVNDAGNQIDNLAKSLDMRIRELQGEKCIFSEGLYLGDEIKDLAKEVDKEKLQSLNTDERLEFLKTFAKSRLLDEIKCDLKRFHVEFDSFFYESSLYKTGAIKSVLEKLKCSGDTYEEDGALYFKATKYGDEKDRVLVKSDGKFTYLLPDIAYHLNKLDRGFDEVMLVLGADHHGYMSRLKGAVTSLGYDGEKIKFFILQMVRILQNGEELKQSKRSGMSVTLREIIDEVGPDALRYLYSAKALATQMDLDLDLAIKKTNENQVYYIQYANARIASLLRKASVSLEKIKPSSEQLYQFREGILLLNDFREMILTSLNERSVHRISTFLLNLSNFVHSYYGNNRIITDNENETREKLYIFLQIKKVISKALDILGVDLLEEM